MTPTKAWTCPTCERKVSTPFCPHCGERPLDSKELTLRGLGAQLLNAVTNIDSRLVRSFRCLLSRPGALTVAFARGQRMPYIGPIQLFLITNVLFFATQSVTKTDILSSPLDSHLNHQDWSALARTLLARRLDAQHTTLERFAAVFDHSVVVNAKSLIFLMVLPLAALLPVLFRGRRQSFVTHVVFSLHAYAFLLLLFCVAMVVAAADVMAGGAGLASARVDNVLTAFNLAGCAGYLYLAIGTAYASRGVFRVLKVVALTLAVSVIVLGYRFALFLITLYTS